MGDSPPESFFVTTGSQGEPTGAGFYPLEHDGEGPFWWTRPRFVLHRPQAQRYLALRLGRAAAGRLNINNQSAIECEIAAGWHWYSIDLGSLHSEQIELDVDRYTPATHDSRELGVMLRRIVWHNDSARHRHMEQMRANAILNEEEYRAGAVIMRSYPPLLRITIATRCNIASAEPCVYCSWKFVKDEEHGAPTYDLKFLEGLDRYLSVAKHVSDCSFGEPPMQAEFPQIVDRIADDSRIFSFTSNGTTLNRKTREALLGRNLTVYVSIDSATAAGFARYRDRSFDRIIANLRALCRDKKLHRNLPHVTASFLVMQSNQHEVCDFIALMHSVGVDRVKLASLHREACMDLDGTIKQRDDFVFDYEKEVMALAELDAIADEAQAAADELGISLYLDWRGFSANHGPIGKQPLCSEPWKSLYVLNRGVFPCCFGRKPIARWKERGNRSPQEFIEDARNGPALQEIRRALASGTFPAYCRSSGSCPIVRKAMNDAPAGAAKAETIDASK